MVIRRTESQNINAVLFRSVIIVLAAEIRQIGTFFIERTGLIQSAHAYSALSWVVELQRVV